MKCIFSSDRIEFELPRDITVSARLYSVLGSLAATYCDCIRLSAGKQILRIDGSRLPSGIYFLRLQAGPIVATRKVLLLR